jgi:hypothetical protein
VGVNVKLSPLFPKVAAWHFNLLSAIGNPFKDLIALSEQLTSSY